MAMRSRSAQALMLTAMVTTAALAGCGGGDESTSSSTTKAERTTTTTTTTAAETTTSRAGIDDLPGCPDTAAVEELLGGPTEMTPSLGGSSSSNSDGGSFNYDYEGCSYELTDGSDGEVNITRVRGHDADGSFFDAAEAGIKADFVDDGMEPLEDLGEDAYRSGTDIVVLVDGAMVFVTAYGDDDEPSLPLARELAESVLAEGSGLVTEADMDCDEIGAMAPESFGTLESTGPTGGVIVIDDLTINPSGCHLSFEDGSSGEVTTAPGDQWDAWVAAEQDSGFTVEYTSLEVAGHRAFDDGEAIIVDDDPNHPLRITSRGDDLDPDQADLRRRLAELVLD
jgi:hypothetical protein